MTEVVPLRVPIWTARAEPLVPELVLAEGPARDAMLARLRALPAEALAALRGVVGARSIAVLGAAAALPWIDGCVYLGRDPRAPRLYLPTTHAPDVPIAVFERAILARLRGTGPWAVSITPPLVVSLALARTIVPRKLEVRA